MPVITVDIDVGGTFTDGFVTVDAQRTYHAKVPTSREDFAGCLFDCLHLVAARLGRSLRDLLSEARVFRFASTIGTNAVLERTGAEVGLLVTAGHEDDLYAVAGFKDAKNLRAFVPPDRVRGVREEVDGRGVVTLAPEREQVLAATRELVAAGVQVIVVALRRAALQGSNEAAVRAFIEERYPPYYLRAVPVQLSSAVDGTPDDFRRTAAAVLNAYLHPVMVHHLYRLENRLRDAGLRQPMLVVQASGGVSRVAKTTAIHTFGAGPAAGVAGLRSVLEIYPQPWLVGVDIGGTSVDVCLVGRERVPLDPDPEVGGLRLGLPMLATRSLAVGGGSIARVDGQRMQVGPRSAGSSPGPAAWGRGGTEPTVTDADVVLGLLADGTVLPGGIRLAREPALRAVEERLAGPLGLSAREAALAVHRRVAEMIGTYLRRACEHEGADAGDAALVAYGGAGPLHACSAAAAAGIDTVLVMPFGAVWNAFGASMMNVVHGYRAPAAGAHGNLPSLLASLAERARLDMAGEGYPADAVTLRCGAVVRRSREGFRLYVDGPSLADDEARRAADVTEFLYTLVGQGEAELEDVVLWAASAIPHLRFQRCRLSPGTAVPLERRAVVWDGLGARATPVFAHAELAIGDPIPGPALIRLGDGVCAVLPGWTYRRDAYGHGLINRNRGEEGRT